MDWRYGNPGGLYFYFLFLDTYGTVYIVDTLFPRSTLLSVVSSYVWHGHAPTDCSFACDCQALVKYVGGRLFSRVVGNRDQTVVATCNMELKLMHVPLCLNESRSHPPGGPIIVIKSDMCSSISSIMS